MGGGGRTKAGRGKKKRVGDENRNRKANDKAYSADKQLNKNKTKQLVSASTASAKFEFALFL